MCVMDRDHNNEIVCLFIDPLPQHTYTHTHTHTHTHVILPIWIFYAFPEDRLFPHGCILCPREAVTPDSHVPFLKTEP